MFIIYKYNLQTNFKKVQDLISESNKIILTTHVVPDGDAIGSVIAMAGYLTQIGKTPVIINHSETPYNLQFMDSGKSIRVFSENTEENIKLINEGDLIFILDTNEFARTKSMQQYLIDSPAKKVCIDHHTGIKEENYTAVISNSVYPATCQILYDFIKSDNEKYLTTEVSSALYVGIMTDTGSFRYPRTDANVFIVCADLINHGADPVQIYENIFANVTMEDIKLTSLFMQSLEFFFDKKVVVGIVTQDDFKSLGLDIQHVEGFSSILMNILGVKIGVILVELRDNIKVSFRSKGELDISTLSKEFNGGGHKNAGGANVKDLTINELKNNILEKLKRYF